ncbi:hypothetical protein P5673_025916 [Acropora cervicornis]|uniref:Uncharacterized protein n=1 Tax=Acropora cervicornis TaxID=6130 RepID=A0AAD9Q182_ACRCE|nr:hypothetical protein P5673_025916 [Acropora cervicornis]
MSFLRHSGICRKCRGRLKELTVTEDPSQMSTSFNINDEMQRMTLDDEEVTFSPIATSAVTWTPKSVNIETPSSIYQPSEGFRTPSEDVYEERCTSKEKLNSFLASRDISPICYSMITPWEEAAERTKFHTRKARKVVIAALEK